MNCRPYVDTDYEALCGWFSARGMSPPPEDLLPVTGYVADGIAAGFMYFADGRLAMLEHFISNPNAAREDADAALDVITESLLGRARLYRCRSVVATTQLSAIKNRAERHGFRDIGQFHFLAKEI